MKFYQILPEEYDDSFYMFYNPNKEFSKEQFDKMIFEILQNTYVKPEWNKEDDADVADMVAELVASYPDVPESEWLETVNKDVRDSKERRAREVAVNSMFEQLQNIYGFVPVTTSVFVNLEKEFWNKDKPHD